MQHSDFPKAIRPLGLRLWGYIGFSLCRTVCGKMPHLGRNGRHRPQRRGFPDRNPRQAGRGWPVVQGSTPPRPVAAHARKQAGSLVSCSSRGAIRTGPRPGERQFPLAFGRGAGAAELSEAITFKGLGICSNPVGLPNTGSFYAPLAASMGQVIEERFMNCEYAAMGLSVDAAEAVPPKIHAMPRWRQDARGDAAVRP